MLSIIILVCTLFVRGSLPAYSRSQINGSMVDYFPRPVIEVEKEDFLYNTIHQFHLWLNELGVLHICNETEGGHQWGANQLRSLLPNLQYFRQTQYF